MNGRIRKIANHLYKIFKVYAALALGGALVSVVVQLIIAKPVTMLVAIGSITFVTVGLFLSAQTQARKRHEGVRNSN